MLCLANLFNCSPRALHPSVMSSSRVKWSWVSWKSIGWIIILSLLFHVHCTTLKSLHFWRSLARQRTSSAVEHSTVSKLGIKLMWESFFVPLIVLNISIPPKVMTKSKMYFQHFYFTLKKWPHHAEHLFLTNCMWREFANHIAASLGWKDTMNIMMSVKPTKNPRQTQKGNQSPPLIKAATMSANTVSLSASTRVRSQNPLQFVQRP